MRLAVIVPFLDEARHLPALLASLAAQARPPDRLVLVDDGSSDARPPSPRRSRSGTRTRPRSGAAVRPRGVRPSRRRARAARVRAGDRRADGAVGRRRPSSMPTSRLPPGALATIEARFRGDPRLGIAGPACARSMTTGRDVSHHTRPEHVEGAAKFYRRACLGGDRADPADPRLGHDRRGARPDARVAHGRRSTRRRSRCCTCAHGRPRRRRCGPASAGARCAYAYGEHPLHALLWRRGRLRERPAGLGGARLPRRLARSRRSAARRAPSPSCARTCGRPAAPDRPALGATCRGLAAAGRLALGPDPVRGPRPRHSRPGGQLPHGERGREGQRAPHRGRRARTASPPSHEHGLRREVGPAAAARRTRRGAASVRRRVRRQQQRLRRDQRLERGVQLRRRRGGAARRASSRGVQRADQRQRARRPSAAVGWRDRAQRRGHRRSARGSPGRTRRARPPRRARGGTPGPRRASGPSTAAATSSSRLNAMPVPNRPADSPSARLAERPDEVDQREARVAQRRGREASGFAARRSTCTAAAPACRRASIAREQVGATRAVRVDDHDGVDLRPLPAAARAPHASAAPFPPRSSPSRSHTVAPAARATCAVGRGSCRPRRSSRRAARVARAAPSEARVAGERGLLVAGRDQHGEAEPRAGPAAARATRRARARRRRAARAGTR